VNEKRLLVSLPGHAVGQLGQNRAGLVQWIPGKAWERDGQMPRLGLDFLRKLGPREHASDLPAWFENLLPERESELRARLCQHHGLRDGQSFALLRAVGHDLIGAAEARDAIVPHDHAASAEVPTNPTEPQNEGESHTPDRLSALTGMQLKFSMSMVNERLVLPAVSTHTQWIVKLAGRDYDELAEVEDATMTWASVARFEVPQHFVAPFAELRGLPHDWIVRQAPAFAIKRFDRRDDGTKVHQEDLCQALDLRPQNKYGDRGPRVSFEGALRLVVDACGDADGREMARRLGFMIASGNSDAHLKNWSIVWGDSTRPRLAPCYDLVATVSWEPLGWRRPDGPQLALRLGGELLFKRLTSEALDRCARDTGIAWLKDSVLEGVERARMAWPEVAGAAPRRMRDAVIEHWVKVPVLRSLGPLTL